MCIKDALYHWRCYAVLPRCCTPFNIYAFWCTQQHFSEEMYKAFLYFFCTYIAIEELIKIENVYLVFSVK